MRNSKTVVVAGMWIGLAILVAWTSETAFAGRSALDGATMPSDLSAQQQVRYRRARTRIDVYPSNRLYRQCTDWYATERRPSGDVIVPHMRCWWARR